MAVTLATTAQDRLTIGFNGTGSGVCGYNGNNYDSNTNPGGLGNGGHRYVLLPLLVDLVSFVLSAIKQVVMSAQMASTCAAGSNGYTTITGATYNRLSASQFTAAVSPAADLTGYFEPNRALAVTQTVSGFGYVAASKYNSSTGLTTITVTGIVLDSGLTSVALGQAVENAPLSSGGGIAAAHFINANFPTA